MPLVVLSSSPAAAQIVPDSTLGAESSQLVINGITIDAAAADLIRAGARRGANLFHSFERFSVGSGQRVYFENPVGVERVFGRITGNLRSDILGTLGVAGGADLFLLNPNGILFGPSARLDVAGSFVASTADRFAFVGGGEFNAIAPQESLLSVNVPLGVQFNSQPQNQPRGNILNQASLVVGSGQTLTLLGDTVSTVVRLAAPGGSAQVLGNQVEIIDNAASNLFGPSGETNLLIAAADDIAVADMTDDALLFAAGTGEIVLMADANADGVGDVVMLDRQDALLTNGRNLTVSGVDLNLGTIDTTVQQDITGGDIINVDAGGPIPDATASGPGTTRFTFTVPNGTASINNLDVRFSAAHTFSGDLSADLTSPSGVSLPLFIGTGNPGENFQDTVFDDQAPIGIDVGAAPFDGRFRPQGEGGLAVFEGQPSEGTWTLTVTDEVPVDSGALLQAGSGAPWGTAQGTQLIVNAASDRISGSVALDAANQASVARVVTSGSGGDGRGGAVAIIAGGEITAERIDTSSLNALGGNVTLDAVGSIRIGSPGISSGSSGSGNGGQIQIRAGESVSLLGDVDASVLSRRGDSGSGGSIKVSSGSGNILIDGNLSSFSLSELDGTGGSGNGGAIDVSSGAGEIRIDGILNSSSTATSATISGDSGNGGDIDISSRSGEIRIGSNINSEANSRSISALDAVAGSSGRGGAIAISSSSGDILVLGSLSSNSGSLAFSGFTQPLESSAVSGFSGDGGAITISSDSGNIVIDNSLSSTSESTVSAESALVSRAASGDSGNGGNITVLSGDGDIVITNRGLRSSSFSSSSASTLADPQSFMPDSTSGTSGSAGNITISSGSGDISIDGSRLDATSFSTFDTFSELSSLQPESISAATGDSGRGGDITISSSSGDIFTDSDLRSFSFSNSAAAGRAGDIALAAPEGEILGSDVQLAVFSVAATGEIAQAGGTATITSDTVSGLEILTLSSNGRSGNVEVRGAGDALRVSDLQVITSGQVEIPAPFQSFNGASGSAEETLTLDFDDFGEAGRTFIENSGNITLSRVEIQADANGNRPAGGTTIVSSGRVTLTNSQISSNANRAGGAGITRIEAGQLVLDRSVIESSTESDSTGRGGNINILADETILRNRGRIAVDSEGRGQGGSIRLRGDRLVLTDNSSVSATTLDSDGGDIALTLNDLLLLAGNSTISTEAGTDEAGGDGGDITIDTRFITASDNSDIVANAFDGRGGNISITARGGVFGITPRDFLTSQSDITASAQNRANFGEIIIQSPEVDPSQSAVELPSAFVAPEVVRSCRDLAQSGSEFIISGRGGIPEGPADSATALLWQDALPIEARDEAITATQIRPAVTAHREQSSAENNGTDISAALVEAWGWLKNPQGQIVLVAENPQSPVMPSSHNCES
ncbi:MAG: filamentous hemagglutinin N-terminal domain-containing protein [Cyanobacteria bacterium P01_A01_bin.135]